MYLIHKLYNKIRIHGMTAILQITFFDKKIMQKLTCARNSFCQRYFITKIRIAFFLFFLFEEHCSNNKQYTIIIIQNLGNNIEHAKTN